MCPFLPHSCLTGYINHSLSVFRIQDFEHHTKLAENQTDIIWDKITECRYQHPCQPLTTAPSPWRKPPELGLPRWDVTPCEGGA